MDDMVDMDGRIGGLLADLKATADDDDLLADRHVRRVAGRALAAAGLEARSGGRVMDMDGLTAEALELYDDLVSSGLLRSARMVNRVVTELTLAG